MPELPAAARERLLSFLDTVDRLVARSIDEDPSLDCNHYAGALIIMAASICDVDHDDWMKGCVAAWDEYAVDDVGACVNECNVEVSDG